MAITPLPSTHIQGILKHAQEDLFTKYFSWKPLNFPCKRFESSSLKDFFSLQFLIRFVLQSSSNEGETNQKEEF